MRTHAPRFEVVHTNAPQPWHARWIASNGEPRWSTENYVDRQSALEAIYDLAAPIGIQGEWPLAVNTARHGLVDVRLVDERKTEDQS